MQKSILILLISGLVATACKKKNNETAIVPSQPETQTEQHTALPITNLALSENHHNFGVIKKGDVVEHTYEVTNTGNQPLVISEVKPACGCTAPEYTKDPILPGQKGKIVLSFNSTNFDGLVNKEASVYANVEQIPIVLTFSAEIKP